MRLVGALLAMKIRAIAVVGAVLRAKALLRVPSLNQRTRLTVKCSSDMNFFARRSLPRRSAVPHAVVSSPVAVLGEYGVVPHRIVHAQANNQRKSRFEQSLSGQFLKNLIHFEVGPGQIPTLSYRTDTAALARLMRTHLGKTILFTDNAAGPPRRSSWAIGPRTASRAPSGI